MKNKSYLGALRATKAFLARSILNLDNLTISSLSTPSLAASKFFTSSDPTFDLTTTLENNFFIPTEPTETSAKRDVKSSQ